VALIGYESEMITFKTEGGFEKMNFYGVVD
jgi:hypothetical protein